MESHYKLQNMTNTIVEIKNLSHRYSKYGEWAVKNVNFTINNNEILGFLGSNGAGKSTTMNIMCGVLNQTEGEVIINGIDLRKYPEEAKKHIGFLPQNPPIYPELTVNEFLAYRGRLRLMPQNKINDAIDRVVDICGLNNHRERVLGNLSGGYRQRAGIAQAIIHEPKLVVLDEPTNGLDPNQTVEVRKLIKNIAEERAVILSTHILPEVQIVCDAIKMIELGNLVFSGTMEEFNNYVAPTSIKASFSKAPEINDIMKIDGVHIVEPLEKGSFRIGFDAEAVGIPEEIVKTSVKEGWDLNAINTEKMSLDLIFAHLSKKASQEYSRR